FIGESGLDHLCPAAGLRPFRAVKPTDVEALFGACQSHIKKPPVLLHRSFAYPFARGLYHRAIEFFRRRPGDGLLAGHVCGKLKNFWIVVRRGHAANIRKKHDFRFEPLGRVDGHHPHRVLARLHIALDRILDPGKIVEKTREGRCGAVFMRHGEAQEFVEHVACFRAEPRFHGAASAIHAEKTGIESERPPPARTRQSASLVAASACLVSVEACSASKRLAARPGASAMRSSSSSPMSGDFSTQARARSFCGSRLARPAAMRSRTAI